MGTPAFSQVRPDAGTLLEPLSSPPPALPFQGPPALLLPPLKAEAAGPSGARIVPQAFVFSGNTVFSSESLASATKQFVGQPTDLAGLNAAAVAVTAYYRSQGYLLTEAYLPEQAFAAAGGTVTIQVIEARLGTVVTELRANARKASKSFAEALVDHHLESGQAVTEYALEKPVLLLRDMEGYDASAIVEPGARLGEANVRVVVGEQGTRVTGSASLDNYGPTPAGAVRAGASLRVGNPLGRGDVLALSGQASDQRGSSLFRAGYSLPFGPAGTRVDVSAARLDYALGKQFAALGASGKAEVLGLGLSHPVVRGRNASLYASINVEQKRLFDETITPVLKSEREVRSVKAGLSGNFTDGLAGGSAFNAFSLSSTAGRLTLGALDFALDQGLGGLATAGAFRKLNVDLQRAQFLSARSSIHASAQIQMASKNLASAEKMALGGPYGVRGYPIGEGIGDSGMLLSLEYRHELPALALLGEPMSLLAFYDYGAVRLNQNDPGFGVPNQLALASAGLGASVGRVGRFLLKTHLAWRISPTAPTTGDADRSPRAWLSAQSWF
ncbi:MAG: ShlB/FhaC/HecB family hemolysin secretion/activation protein [Polaromonas sp.]|nr:ShlB/FhaC/HecB family hemolysin secretion/activation protein [Polaromonas sp.]